MPRFRRNPTVAERFQLDFERRARRAAGEAEEEEPPFFHLGFHASGVTASPPLGTAVGGTSGGATSAAQATNISASRGEGASSGEGKVAVSSSGAREAAAGDGAGNFCFFARLMICGCVQ